MRPLAEMFARWIAPDLARRADHYRCLSSAIDLYALFLEDVPAVAMVLGSLRALDRDGWVADRSDATSFCNAVRKMEAAK